MNVFVVCVIKESSVKMFGYFQSYTYFVNLNTYTKLFQAFKIHAHLSIQYSIQNPDIINLYISKTLVIVCYYIL
jgi:hypothetical protein